MPVIEILNPQDPIPGVESEYTVVKGEEVDGITGSKAGEVGDHCPTSPRFQFPGEASP